MIFFKNLAVRLSVELPSRHLLVEAVVKKIQFTEQMTSFYCDFVVFCSQATTTFGDQDELESNVKVSIDLVFIAVSLTTSMEMNVTRTPCNFLWLAYVILFDICLIRNSVRPRAKLPRCIPLTASKPGLSSNYLVLPRIFFTLYIMKMNYHSAPSLNSLPHEMHWFSDPQKYFEHILFFHCFYGTLKLNLP